MAGWTFLASSCVLVLVLIPRRGVAALIGKGRGQGRRGLSGGLETSHLEGRKKK